MADTVNRRDGTSTKEEQAQANSKTIERHLDVANNTPPIVPITDRFGNTFYIGNAGDFWHPPYPVGRDTDYRTHVRKIREMEIRPDDVLICSFPKTGTHWHMEIIRMLMDRKAEYIEDSLLLKCFIDLSTADVVATLPSPRMIITHVPFRHLPKQALEKKIKIVFLKRDPKDVLVSYYQMLHSMKSPLGYPGTFEQFFYTYLELGTHYGDFFDHLIEYQKGIESHSDVDIFTSVFEDMKTDPVGGVKLLNQYLDTGCSDQLCEDIAAVCSFKTLKAEKDAKAPAALKNLFKNKENTMYRKGEVGDWKNHLTDEMNEVFEKELQRRMAGYKDLLAK